MAMPPAIESVSPIQRALRSLAKVSFAGGATLVSPLTGGIATLLMTSRLFGYNGRNAISITRSAMCVAALAAMVWVGRSNGWKPEAALFNSNLFSGGHSAPVAAQQLLTPER
jgi:hypothetical protein